MRAKPNGHCSICGATLNQPDIAKSTDCGGDCLACMVKANDPDACKELEKAIKAVITQYCDGTYNGLEHANFIEFSSDGKTPQALLTEIMEIITKCALKKEAQK